jgi:hypothetical protein
MADEERCPTPKARARSGPLSQPVSSCNGLKVCEHMIICKQTEFDFIASEVKKGGVPLKDLT